MADSVYPSVKSAIANGLFHPGCTHTLGAYIPGLTKPLEDTENPKGYAERQVQRGHERKIRHWKRRIATARGIGDRPMVQHATGRLRAAQEALEQFLADTGRRRAPHREGLASGKAYAAKPVAPPPSKPKPYERANSLAEAQEWAKANRVYRVTKNAQEAASTAILTLEPDLPLEKLQRRADALRNNLEEAIAFAPADLLKAQNAANQLASNEKWRAIEQKYGATYIIPTEYERGDMAPIRVDSSKHGMFLMANVREYYDAEITPYPDDESLEESGGLAGAVRYKYAQALLRDGRLPSSLLSKYYSSLPLHRVRADLIADAEADPDKVFPQLFSIITHPRYSEKVYPQWVNDMRNMIFSELGI